MNRDPLGEAGFETTCQSALLEDVRGRGIAAEISPGFNLYGMVGNNPVNRVDPLGLEWLWREGPLMFCKSGQRRDCDDEQNNCLIRANLFCAWQGGRWSDKGGAGGNQGGGVVYGGCYAVYFKACYVQKQACQKWNSAHGF